MLVAQLYFSFDNINLQWELIHEQGIFNTGRYDVTSNLQYFTSSSPIDGTNYNPRKSLRKKFK